MVVIENGEKIKIDFSKMTLVKDKIMCKPMTRHNITDSGIIVPDAVKQDCVPTIVIRKGPECTLDLEAGDIVLIRPSAGIFFGTNKEDALILITQPEVLTFIKRSDTEVVNLPTQEEKVELGKIVPIGNA